MWSHLGFVPVIRINYRLKNLLGSAMFPTLYNEMSPNGTFEASNQVNLLVLVLRRGVL